jgi:hypothetical protein
MNFIAMKDEENMIPMRNPIAKALRSSHLRKQVIKPKKGRQFVGRDDSGFIVCREDEVKKFGYSDNLLKTQYLDGRILASSTLSKIRERVAAGMR